MIVSQYFKRAIQLLEIFSLLFFFLNCTDSKRQVKTVNLQIPLGLDSLTQFIPGNNPLTIKKIKLGRKLFFDERLSLDGTLSCATCHNPLLGFADGRSVAVGIEGLEGPRSTPAIINRLFSEIQFWDGRAQSLEEQILEPIENPIEMNNPLENVVYTLNQDEAMRNEFQEVFGTDVSIDGLQKAIASFERTLLSGNSAFDKFKAGNNKALPESAQKGLLLFESKRINCVVCHEGTNFTDELFHNSGIGMNKEKPDWGRFVETKNDTDRGRFKTPTLRDIARTAPYMHDGSLRTLREVIDFYDNGGINNPNLSEHIKQLKLTEEEKVNLVEFLRSLSGENPLAAGEKQSTGIN